MAHSILSTDAFCLKTYPASIYMEGTLMEWYESLDITHGFYRELWSTEEIQRSCMKAISPGSWSRRCYIIIFLTFSVLEFPTCSWNAQISHCRFALRLLTKLCSPCASLYLSAEQLYSKPVPSSLLNHSFKKYSPSGDIADVETDIRVVKETRILGLLWAFNWSK